MKKQQRKEVTLSLSDPTFDEVHKIGLLGLHMVLGSIDSNVLAKNKVDFKLGKTSITIGYEDDKQLIRALLQVLYELRDGVLRLGAFGKSSSDGLAKEIEIHKALLSSMFSQTNSRKLEENETSYEAEIDGKNKKLNFKKITKLTVLGKDSSAYRKNREGKYQVISVLAPGRSHKQGGSSADGYLHESLPQYLATLGFINGCYMYKGGGKTFLVGLIVTDLGLASQARKDYFANYDPFVSGYYEAVVRTVLQQKVNNLKDESWIEGVVSYTFAQPSWNKNACELARINMEEDVPEDVIRKYCAARSGFPSYWYSKDEKHFKSALPALVVENAIKNRPWFDGIDRMGRLDLWRLFGIASKGDIKMLQKEERNEYMDKFIACVEYSWRNEMGRIASNYAGTNLSKKFKTLRANHIYAAGRLHGVAFMEYLINFLKVTEFPKIVAEAMARAMKKGEGMESDTEQIRWIKCMLIFALYNYRAKEDEQGDEDDEPKETEKIEEASL